MSKKNINIALIVLVLSLWGTVAYKSLYQYLFSNNDDLGVNLNTSQVNFTTISKDTFDLQKVTHDPFLNKQLEKVEVLSTIIPVSKPIAVKKPKVEKKIEAIQWPQIFYYGYIKSKDKTEELILIKVDNQLYKLRKNATVNGLLINKLYKDSIEVKYNNQSKKIYKD